MQSASVDAGPERDPHECAGRDAIDMGAIERCKQSCEKEGGQRVADLKLSRIEESNHDYRADVVDDGGGGKEDTELNRHPRAHHDDDGEGECR